MTNMRLAGLSLALALVLAGPSLVGSSGQAPAAAPDPGPFDSLHFRSIGPASMSGRISDLAVYEANPSIYYVGTAHGGVWKTTNNGTTFEAQFQNDGLMSIGDVAISQSNPDLIWVGTGEAANRQSVSWGDGIYKSTDGGKTWSHMGLRTSRNINRIVIDPRDHNVLFVAAVGSLWGPGGERGVYRTKDGGNTWEQVLKVDEDTGANEVVLDPLDSRIVYATTYQRRRTPANMNGGGPGSGIWKSTDGGDTWTRLKGGGIPDGPLGRIAINVYRRRPNILYALIEGPSQPSARGAGAQAPQAQAGAAGRAGGRGGAPAVSDAPTGLYRSDDSGATWRKVNNANPRPMYFSELHVDPTDPEVVYFGGVGLHQSLDGGRTVATDVARPTHDDVHAIWIDPADPDHVLIGNDGGLAVSYDRATTWVFVPNLPVGLFYHVSYDMAIPYNVCGGMQDNYNWCGPSAVRGNPGIANYHWTTLQGGDGFVVLQDPTTYRVAFSESQDGNMVRVDRVTGETMSVRPQPAPGEPPLRWNWDTPLAQSPHDPKVIYAPANKVFRSADRGDTWVAISPDLTSNANRDEFVVMGVKASDINIARNDGIRDWPTIVSFAESPKRAGLYYAGTDDGMLQVSRDGGKTWTNVIDNVPGLPKGIYVSEVVPSRFDEATVYATFDGHRQNDYEPHVYASTDFGQTWKSIVSNLEDQVARTLTEDVRNPDVLYLGTETGIFVTIDRGSSWIRLGANLPRVRVDEITLHPRDNAMIVGTHGRAIWILDHLEPIQEYAAARAAAGPSLFTPPPFAMYRRPARDRNYEFWGDQVFYGENPPQAARISWHLKEPAREIQLRIADASGRQVREISGDVLDSAAAPGIQTACWDLRVQPVPAPQPQAGAREGGAARGQAAPGGRQGGAGGGRAVSPFGAGCGGGGGFGGGGTAGPFVLPGTYQVSLVVDGKTVGTKPLKVMADPEVALTAAERKRMFDMAMEMHELQGRTTEVANRLGPIGSQMAGLSKEIGGRSDVPAEVKTSFEAFNKELTETMARFAPASGRGGRGGGGQPNPVASLSQAKNALMGGMWPTRQMLDAYGEAKSGVPKAIEEVNALIARASTLSTTLAKYNLTLTVSTPTRPTEATK